MKRIDVTIDVTDAAGLGETATVAMTVALPDPSGCGSPPIVCFAKPGAGFSREYFTHDLPGPAAGSQADWHTARGWVFVSVDHLGVGGSSTQHDPVRLTAAPLAAAAVAAERELLTRLQLGTLDPGFPALVDPVRLGIGQSMGGCLTVVQEGRHHCYDGIAVLGFSATHTHPPVPAGESDVVAAWRTADEPSVVLNRDKFASAYRASFGGEPPADALAAPFTLTAMEWQFYFEDVVAHLPDLTNGLPPWISIHVPVGVVMSVLTPGVIAREAAAVDVPVLVAMGERDVVVDPRGEPRAYLSADSVDLFVCPRMAHMHNFAGTRELFWERIQTWGAWVAATTLARREVAHAPRGARR